MWRPWAWLVPGGSPQCSSPSRPACPCPSPPPESSTWSPGTCSGSPRDCGNHRRRALWSPNSVMGWRKGSEEGIIADCNVISREDYPLVGEKQNSSPESLQRPKYKFSVNTASENRQVPAQACSARSGNLGKDHCPQSQRLQTLDPQIRLYWGNIVVAPVLVCPGCHNRNPACG